MIRTILYQSAAREVATGDKTLLLDWQQEPDTLVWVDLADNPPLSEQTMLAEPFGLHPLAIQDAQRTRHQPKIGHSSILLNRPGPDVPEFEFETIQIAMFIGGRFLVARHSGPAPGIERFRQTLERDGGVFPSGAAGPV